MLPETAITDALLRKLSKETDLVGKQIVVPGSKLKAGYEATVINVIILPFSDFYRNQFLTFYQFFNQNAVKALKEMVHHFPYTPDYRLDIGYVLDTRSSPFGINDIKGRDDFDLPVVMQAG